MSKQYEDHEAANIFPLMSGVAYEEFMADIVQHGLNDPIILHEGKILDGRNRYRACRDTNTPVKTEKWDGVGSPIGFVWSANFRRRQLSEAQRAMAVANPLAFAYFKEEAAKRQRDSGGDQKSPAAKNRLASIDANRSDAPKPRSKSSAAASKAASVSPASVERAQRVHRDGCADLIHAVEQNDISVSAAARVAIHCPKGRQAELVKLGKKAVVAESQKYVQPPGAGSKKKKPRQLVTEILRRVNKLVDAIKQDEHGTANQRAGLVADLERVRALVNESSAYLK